MAKKTIQPVVDPLADFNMGEHIKEQRDTTDNSAKKEKKEKFGTTNTAAKSSIKRTANKKKDSLSFTDSVKKNITKWNGSNETGKPVYFSENILSALRNMSEKYHRRVSVRAIAQAVLDTFINELDGSKIIDEYMKEIGYQEPSAEKLTHNKLMAEQAKKRRAAEKNK